MLAGERHNRLQDREHAAFNRGIFLSKRLREKHDEFV